MIPLRLYRYCLVALAVTVILKTTYTAARPKALWPENGHNAASQSDFSSAAKLGSNPSNSKSLVGAVHGGEETIHQRESDFSHHLDRQSEKQVLAVDKHSAENQQSVEREGVYFQNISIFSGNASDRESSHENTVADQKFEPHNLRFTPMRKNTPVITEHALISDANNDDISSKQVQQIGETSDSLIKRLCKVQGKKYTVCYEEHGVPKCKCNGALADCSGQKYVPNLSYAPKLPEGIKCLRFRYNNVRHFTDSYFANISDFRVVDFSSNSLQTVSAQTFNRFSNLQYLILNDNDLPYKYLKYVLNYPPTLRLDIVGLRLEKIPVDYFYHYWNIPTSEIYMDLNYIPDLNLKEFAWLDNLRYLSLKNTSIQRVVSAPMKALKVLDLSNNNIIEFPVTCNSTTITTNKIISDPDSLEKSSRHFRAMQSDQIRRQTHSTSLFPSLQQLLLSVNKISTLPAYDEICLPQTTLLDLKSNNVSEIGDNAFWNMRSLEVLRLDKMHSGITRIGRSPFNISALTTLSLTKNKIDFSSDKVSKNIFEGCSNVLVLHIDHNQLSGVSDAQFAEVLGHITQLRYLYLGSSGITYVPVEALLRLPNLRKLYIYINAIKEIPPGAFDNMPSLQYLYMDNNQISTIKQNAFSEETRSRLKLINLSRNNFMCNCDLIWFKKWLKDAGPEIFMDYNDYKCSDRPNESVQNYELSAQACLMSRQTYILFVVCLSIFITVFLVFALVYRYRWNIRLMMYERRISNHAYSQSLTEDRDFQFDLFVVYGNDDSDWVEDVLVPVLENQWHLKTCIHQRDFVAGGTIVDNIVIAMNSSRRILVVISSRFALSKWCNFELQLCQSHVITHDLPSLLVIKLDDIESRDMSAAMYALYNTTCFLELPEETSLSDPQEAERFWTRLRNSLKPLIDAHACVHNTTVKSTEHLPLQSL